MTEQLTSILIDGLALAGLASALLILILWINPRLLLHDYPDDVKAMVAPKTPREHRQSLVVGIPFLLLLFAVPLFSTLALKSRHPSGISFGTLAFQAFGVAFIFNLVDWLILDWLMFCTITPGFLVIPGSEGAAGYKDYGMHFRGFLIGTLFSAGMGIAIAGIAMLL